MIEENEWIIKILKVLINELKEKWLSQSWYGNLRKIMGETLVIQRICKYTTSDLIKIDFDFIESFVRLDFSQPLV